MDWNRRHCARRGHVLYEPVEPEYRDRIKAETALGPAWRCLRCGDFVLETPKTSGPATDAPVIPRGKALRSLLIMRLLAVERVFRFFLVGAAAYAVWRFENSQGALSQLFEKDLTLFRPLATHWGYDLDHSSIVDTIRKSFNYKHSTLTVVAILLAVYAAIELIEAVGLWLAKRWGEYFAVVATAAFLPIEIHEIISKQSGFKIATFALNVVAVLYLLLSKRLFGLRGGKAAAERELHSESLLEIEKAAGEAPGAAEPDAEASDPEISDPEISDAEISDADGAGREPAAAQPSSE
ncbi:MAG TPA: DUF2127 domain-containing protein [Actinocrinis sp.]|nr:DUF2127 domain-containing protein [Actinocrinis sp.]